MNIHLFSLTEDTFFLALEDIHSRLRQLQGLHNQADSRTTKQFKYSSPEEYNRKTRELNNRYQNRQLDRSNNKVFKSFKKQAYENGTGSEGYKSLKQNYMDKYNDGIMRSGAGYNPLNNTVAKNRNFEENNPKTNKPATKEELNKADNHEYEHKYQFNTIKNKYGNTGVRQALARSSLAAGLLKSNGDENKFNDYYKHLPTEKKAFEVGAKVNSPTQHLYGKDSKENYNKLAHQMVNPKAFHKVMKQPGVSDDTIARQSVGTDTYNKSIGRSVKQISEKDLPPGLKIH